jgi:hypothetical protein
VSFVTIALCVASQRMFIIVVISLSTQSGNFWIRPRIARQHSPAENGIKHGYSSSVTMQCATLLNQKDITLEPENETVLLKNSVLLN